jgi:hypothetical protein
MILSEREDLDTWLDFAAICRVGGNTALAERILTMAQQRPTGATGGEEDAMDRRIQLAMMKLKWTVKDRITAVSGLEKLIKKYMVKPPAVALPTIANSFASFSSGVSRSPSSAFGSSLFGGFNSTSALPIGGNNSMAAGGLQLNSTNLNGSNFAKQSTAFGASAAPPSFGGGAAFGSNAFGLGLALNNQIPLSSGNGLVMGGGGNGLVMGGGGGGLVMGGTGGGGLVLGGTGGGLVMGGAVGGGSSLMDPSPSAGGLHIVNPSALPSLSGSTGQLPSTGGMHNVYYSPRTSDCLSGTEIKWVYENVDDSRVLLKCLLTLGEWKIAMLPPNEPIDASTRREVLDLYYHATMVDPSSYSAWHQWGLCNYRAIEEIKSTPAAAQTTVSKIKMATVPSSVPNPSPGGVSIPRLPLSQLVRSSASNHETLMTLASNAASGLLRALALGTRRWSSSVIQDMLCVLSIWFRYAKNPEVASVLENGLKDVHVDNWLGILPQLIARIDHPEAVARGMLHDLLIKLGERHVRALLYPLFVALKSPKVDRKSAAETIMNNLKQHSKVVIEQAIMVSQELIRVAILWHEEWHETIEEASRMYFSEGNIQGMIDVLQPLQTEIEKGPNTVREGSFIAAYGQELKDAWEALKNYQKYMQNQSRLIPFNGAVPVRNSNAPEDHFLHQAWDIYYNVFTKITQQLPGITALDLQTCSPALMDAQDLGIGVPGTYSADGSFVRIQKFGSTVHIIRSKQRPRKIRIYGQDGNCYVFLLKGHEDLRQDERAMQFFGLVNALLQHDSLTGGESHDLSIQRYAVIPLSPTAGLISWVPNCDTLHDLIRDYRDSRKTMFNLEHKLMQQMVPANHYDHLTMIGKLEVFEHALANTPGDDLAKILWIKSESSEVWLQRRTNYTRSLAVMSIVGYVLGLGDRHPSNLMLDRKTGKILHIDFGDCFEVAQQREKFPEKVPFRLTRMLVNAMEVSGIEGTFRLTCERVSICCLLHLKGIRLIVSMFSGDDGA